MMVAVPVVMVVVRVIVWHGRRWRPDDPKVKGLHLARPGSGHHDTAHPASWLLAGLGSRWYGPALQ